MKKYLEASVTTRWTYRFSSPICCLFFLWSFLTSRYHAYLATRGKHDHFVCDEAMEGVSLLISKSYLIYEAKSDSGMKLFFGTTRGAMPVKEHIHGNMVANQLLGYVQD